MNNDTLILQKIDKLEGQLKRVLNILSEQRQQKRWVKASDVLLLTGRDREWLRRARESGIIEYKRDKGFLYNLESLPPQFIKAQS